MARAERCKLERYYNIKEQELLLDTTSSSQLFDSVQEAIDEIRNGNFVIVVDNMDRENEGDFVIAAEFMTTEKMAFMVRHSSGVICVPTIESRLDQLELPQMVQHNTDSLQTAYTVSTDYKVGTTTGISAHDRALTVCALANPTIEASEFSKPGHVFPLKYHKGGVMNRVGHTEASVDLCKLAGLYPCAAISEIVLDDGRMARRDDLVKMSKEWNLKIISIDQLRAFIINSKQFMA